MNRQEIEKEISDVVPYGTDRDKASKYIAQWHITKQIELLEQVPTDSYSLCIFLEETITNLKKELE